LEAEFDRSIRHDSPDSLAHELWRQGAVCNGAMPELDWTAGFVFTLEQCVIDNNTF
jgi:hypothetical protein